MMNRDKLDLEVYYESFGLSRAEADERVKEGLAKIEAGYPLAYLVKEAYFYDLVFNVDERVLIPRPDTERLCEKAIKLLPKNGRFVDFGVGSGAITVTILYHRPDLTAVAVDLSSDALAVARDNAYRYGVLDRLTLIEGDMTEKIFEHERFDLVISNPPYIPTADILKYPSLVHEPQMALTAPDDGMELIDRLIESVSVNMKKNAVLVLEMSPHQTARAERKLRECGFEKISVFADQFGKMRFVAAVCC